MRVSVRKARKLLDQGKARIDGYRPFTIRLTYATGETRQDLVLGIKAGYRNIGFSVVSPWKEVSAGEIKLLEGQVERNRERVVYRRKRRSRLRYRKPRVDNRKKPEGWLAPSIQHKFDSHIKIVNRLKSVLSIAKTIVEVATFDIQKNKVSTLSEGGYFIKRT